MTASGEFNKFCREPCPKVGSRLRNKKPNSGKCRPLACGSVQVSHTAALGVDILYCTIIESVHDLKSCSPLAYSHVLIMCQEHRKREDRASVCAWVW